MQGSKYRVKLDTKKTGMRTVELSCRNVTNENNFLTSWRLNGEGKRDELSKCSWFWHWFIHLRICYELLNVFRGVAWFFRLGTHRKHKENKRRKREALGGSGSMLPQKIFIFRASEIPFPMFFRGNFHKSKHEKNAIYSVRVVYT